MKKRGQITLFLIIGIVLVFSTAVILFIRGNIGSLKPGVEKGEEVPYEIQPVKEFVDKCIDSVAYEAIQQLGMGGGYINPVDIPSDLEISPFAVDSDVLIYEPQYLPYWHYVDNNFVVRSNRPSLKKVSDGDNSVESQLEHYMNANLKACTRGFSDFEQFEVSEGVVKTDVKITKNNVVFKVNYPLQVNVKGSPTTYSVSKFVRNADVNLKGLWDFATEIINFERESTFIENIVKDLIVLYAGAGSDLPEMSGLTLGDNIHIYVRHVVEQIIRDEILDLLRIVKITNALNNDPSLSNSFSDPLRSGIYKMMLVRMPDDDKQHPYAVSFFYPPDTPIHVSIGDSEVYIPPDIIPSNFITRFIGLSLKDERVKYDVSFPVIMRLYDPYAFNNRGLEFYVALEANIINNEPVRAEALSNVTAYVSPISINDPGQLINKSITVRTINALDDSELVGVRIYYRCGQRVFIGETELSGGQAALTANFPYCAFGGKIIAEKQGYFSKPILFNNLEEGPPESFTFELWPFKEINIKVKKRTEDLVSQVLYPDPYPSSPAEYYRMKKEAATELGELDKVSITMQRVKEDPDETDVPLISFIWYQTEESPINVDYEAQRQAYDEMYANGSITRGEYEEMINNLDKMSHENITIPLENYSFNLVPGTYRYVAYLYYNGEVYIPAETREDCVTKILGVCVDHQTTEYPELNQTGWPSGGGLANITIYKSDLYSGKQNMTLYVFDFGVPSSWDEMLNMKNLQEYSEQNNELLKPMFE
ncbi:hypothetical protein D6745_04080 [Candidatus Woesearchaeota archaeon]|nr:MAG: hypothetical protein D6745_04080 [Candidatus Woesearchaeota archaeon]